MGWLEALGIAAQVIEATATVLGVLIALGTVIFLWVQYSQGQLGLRTTSRGTVYDLTERLKQTLLVHHQHRKYILGGSDVDESDAVYSEVQALADYVITHLELITTHQCSLESDNRDAWIAFVCFIYDHSPVIRELLERRRQTFPPGFWRVIESSSIEGTPEKRAILRQQLENRRQPVL